MLRVRSNTTQRGIALASIAAVLSLGVLLLWGATAGLAHGQERRSAAAREADAREAAAREAAAREADAREADAASDAPRSGDEDGARAESHERVERGEKVKAIRFSGLDVSGRLKSPQLVYFLNRMRAEFDRPRLPHRSFLPEMERSTRTKSF